MAADYFDWFGITKYIQVDLLQVKTFKNCHLLCFHEFFTFLWGNLVMDGYTILGGFLIFFFLFIYFVWFGFFVLGIAVFVWHLFQKEKVGSSKKKAQL